MSFLKGFLVTLGVIFAILLIPLWGVLIEMWPIWFLLAVPILAIYGFVKLVSSAGKN